MRNKLTLVLISLGIAGGLMLAVPTIISPKTLTAPPSETIDIPQINRSASNRALPSFDDDYQIYLGELDVLRPYPTP